MARIARGGTPLEWVAPPGARLPGIVPGSDGCNRAEIVRWMSAGVTVSRSREARSCGVTRSLPAARSVVMARIARGGKPLEWVAPPGARLPGIVPGSDGCNRAEIVRLMSARDYRLPLSGGTELRRNAISPSGTISGHGTHRSRRDAARHRARRATHKARPSCATHSQLLRGEPPSITSSIPL